MTQKTVSTHKINDKKKKTYYLTFDVDYQPGTEKVIPEILKFLEEEKIQATFFITGLFAVENPNIIKQIAARKHGIGVHGWDHGFGDSNEDFFIDRFEIQKRNILKTKKLLEELISTDVILNRNPNLWVNDQLPYVLEQVGMKIDSSYPALRFVGQIRKFKYSFRTWRQKFLIPVDRYFLIELPPSAFILPFNTSFARMFGEPCFLLFQRFLSCFRNVIVLYTHPAEFMDAAQVEYDDGELERYKKNTGPQLFETLKSSIYLARSKGYSFESMENIIK